MVAAPDRLIIGLPGSVTVRSTQRGVIEMRFMPFVLVAAICLSTLLLVHSTVEASIITVRQDGSGDFTTVAIAVLAAAPNDSIDVGAGTYAEEVIVDKSLSLFSQAGPGSTVLDGEDAHRIMWFTGTITAEVDGLTFRRGYRSGVGNGGAVRVQQGANVVIKNCSFENNTAYAGAGVFVIDAPSELTLEDCVFSGNHSQWSGTAGQVVQGGQLNAVGCTFYQNTVTYQAASLQCNEGVMNVRECLFYDNTSADLSGGLYYYYSSGLVRNNTFHGNGSPGTQGGTIVVNFSPFVTVDRNILSGDTGGYGLRILHGGIVHECNVYWSNHRGAVDGDELAPDEQIADPIFCNLGQLDFSIAYESPAAPVNSLCSELIGAFEPACSGPVPVFVSFFEAVCVEEGIRLDWDITAEETVRGFRLYRQAEQSDQLFVINDGQLLSAGDRSFTDRAVTPGETYRYRLAAVLHDNTEVMSGPVDATTHGFLLALDQNNPNPFNPTTTISFTLPGRVHARLSIYDVEGKGVATLVDQVLDGGSKAVTWNGRDDRGSSVSSGVYFYRLVAGNRTLTKKMVFIQ